MEKIYADKKVFGGNIIIFEKEINDITRSMVNRYLRANQSNSYL